MAAYYGYAFAFISSYFYLQDRSGPMSNDICFEDCGQYIYCRYRGRFMLEPLIDLTITINEYLRLNGSGAVLVDVVNSYGEMGIFTRFRLETTISEFMNKRLKAAVWARPDQLQNQSQDAVAAGARLELKVFTDLQTAIKWLTSEETRGAEIIKIKNYRKPLKPTSHKKTASAELLFFPPRYGFLSESGWGYDPAPGKAPYGSPETPATGDNPSEDS